MNSMKGVKSGFPGLHVTPVTIYLITNIVNTSNSNICPIYAREDTTHNDDYAYVLLNYLFFWRLFSESENYISSVSIPFETGNFILLKDVIYPSKHWDFVSSVCQPLNNSSGPKYDILLSPTPVWCTPTSLT